MLVEKGPVPLQNMQTLLQYYPSSVQGSLTIEEPQAADKTSIKKHRSFPGPAVGHQHALCTPRTHIPFPLLSLQQLAIDCESKWLVLTSVEPRSNVCREIFSCLLYTVSYLLCLLVLLSFTHRQEEHAVHSKRGVAGVEGQSGEEQESHVWVRIFT